MKNTCLPSPPAVGPALSQPGSTGTGGQRLSLRGLLLFSLLSALAAGTASAQVANYSFSSSSGTYVPATGTLAASAVENSLTNPGNLDAVNVSLPDGTIPFPFVFNGNTYTGLNVNSNGFVTFGRPLPLPVTSGPLSNSTPFDGAIAVFAPSLSGVGLAGNTDPGNLAEVRYETRGQAPNRIFVVQWSRFRRYTADTEALDFQVWLHETSNQVSLVYGPMTVGITSAGSMPSPQVGLRGFTNTDFHSRNGTTWTTTQKGGVNYNTVNVSPTVFPAPGLRYTFTPPAVQAIDAGVRALLAPAATGCRSEAEEVTVLLKNYGSTTLTRIPVQVTVAGPATATLSGTYQGSLAPGATAAYTLPGAIDVSAGGIYTLSAATTLADGNPGNDAMRPVTISVAPHLALPLPLVNFSSYDGSNLNTAQPGWVEATGATVPAGITSSWNNSTTNQTGTLGFRSARFNFSGTGNTGWLISPEFTATAASVVYFKAALTEFNNANPDQDGMDTNDEVRVMVSEDCGATFSTAYTFNAANQPASTFADYAVKLDSYAGRSVIVAFVADEGITPGSSSPLARGNEATGPSDYDFHIAQIRIDNQQPIDLGVTALRNPDVTGCFGSAVPVRVTVRNFGSAVLNFAATPATVTVGVSGAVNQLLTATLSSGTLAPDMTLDVTAGTLNMSAAGTYTFQAAVAVAGDGTAQNDALLPQTRTVVNALSLPLAPATFNTFNGSNLSAAQPGWREGSGNLYPGGSTSGWEAANAAQAAALGSVTARVNLQSNMRRAWLVGPLFTATRTSSISLDLAVTAANGTGTAQMGSDDKVQLMISTDCGVSFSSLRTFSASSQLGPTLSNYKISLGRYGGQNIMLAVFATDGQTDDPENYDFHVDNFRVEDNRFAQMSGQPASEGAASFALSAEAYPNPFHTQVTLQVNAASEGTLQVQIADVTGRTVLLQQHQVTAGAQRLQLQLDEQLPHGLYLVRLQHGEKQMQLKLTKE